MNAKVDDRGSQDLEKDAQNSGKRDKKYYLKRDL